MPVKGVRTIYAALANVRFVPFAIILTGFGCIHADRWLWVADEETLEGSIGSQAQVKANLFINSGYRCAVSQKVVSSFHRIG